MPDAQMEYVGFWARLLASLVDSILVVVALAPLLLAIYGPDYIDPQREGMFAGPADLLIQLVLPAIAVVLFWIYRRATPGKMLVGAEVVDAHTGAALGTRQSIIRYLGYYVSLIPLFLGFIWVAFDPRKQGWHDKLAGSVVVRARRGTATGPLSGSA